MEERLEFLQKLRHGTWENSIPTKPAPPMPLTKETKKDDGIKKSWIPKWIGVKDIIYISIILVLVYMIITSVFCQTIAEPSTITSNIQIPTPPPFPYAT